MFSGNEWIIVVIVAVLLFGGTQIPKLARSLGQAQKEFKKGIAEGETDDDVEDEPVAKPTATGRRKTTGK